MINNTFNNILLSDNHEIVMIIFENDRILRPDLLWQSW